MANGSCLCGAIRYRLDDPFAQMLHCHCSRCRRHHGVAYATFVGAPTKGFAWLAGRDRIATYVAEEPGAGPRYFCPDCGSVMPASDSSGDQIWVPAGNLDACDAQPSAHMYAASKASWWTISDAVPRFDGPPPGHPDPNVQTPVPTSASDKITGGCLCSAIRYEITPPPLFIVNCHCSRCRRARSAAHGTNLFVNMDQLAITRGEAKMKVFDLPGAERFGQNFCSDCGGKVPRRSPKIGRWTVPAGSLDGDPGAKPALHIFVGSKASWDTIADTLPQFETTPP